MVKQHQASASQPLSSSFNASTLTPLRTPPRKLLSSSVKKALIFLKFQLLMKNKSNWSTRKSWQKETVELNRQDWSLKVMPRTQRTATNPPRELTTLWTHPRSKALSSLSCRVEWMPTTLILLECKPHQLFNWKNRKLEQGEWDLINRLKRWWTRPGSLTN